MPPLFCYDFMKSIIYNANARFRDPVGECLRDIETLLSKIQDSGYSILLFLSQMMLFVICFSKINNFEIKPFRINTFKIHNLCAYSTNLN